MRRATVTRMVRRRVFTALCGWVAVSSWLGRAHAQTTPDNPPAAATETSPAAPVSAVEAEARTRVARGHELFDAGDHKLALIEFERAYELLPSYKILFNIGQVHFELGEYARAHAALSRFLSEGGADVPPGRRASVENDLAGLAKRIATITITTNVPDVEIALGDQAPVRTPIENRIVDAGMLRIVASKQGFVNETKMVRLAGGDQQTVRFELRLASYPGPHPEAPEKSGLPPAAVVSWIATGVLGATAIGFGVGAISAQSRFERMRDEPIPGSPADAAADLRSQGNFTDALAITTDVLIVSTVVAGGVALYFTLKGHKKAPAYARALPTGFRF